MVGRIRARDPVIGQAPRSCSVGETYIRLRCIAEYVPVFGRSEQGHRRTVPSSFSSVSRPTFSPLLSISLFPRWPPSLPHSQEISKAHPGASLCERERVFSSETLPRPSGYVVGHAFWRRSIFRCRTPCHDYLHSSDTIPNLPKDPRGLKNKDPFGVNSEPKPSKTVVSSAGGEDDESRGREERKLLFNVANVAHRSWYDASRDNEIFSPVQCARSEEGLCFPAYELWCVASNFLSSCHSVTVTVGA